MLTINQDILKEESELYKKLDVQINKQIATLKSQKARAGQQAKNGDIQESQRLVWKGMEIAYGNALEELTLAHERAHYNFKKRT